MVGHLVIVVNSLRLSDIHASVNKGIVASNNGLSPRCQMPNHHLNQGWISINTLRPRQMDAISQTTFSNAFS